jgi:hypothetical protein
MPFGLAECCADNPKSNSRGHILDHGIKPRNGNNWNQASESGKPTGSQGAAARLGSRDDFEIPAPACTAALGPTTRLENLIRYFPELRE